MTNNNLIEIENVYKHFEVKKGVFEQKSVVYAVNGISFNIAEGETLGLVGESGCGKSTTGKIIVNLLKLDRGSVKFDGKNISDLPDEEFRPFRFNMQIIFQDPFASLNPRIRVGDAIGEILKINKNNNYKKEALRILKEVGLSEDTYYKYPHEFSGGQRQRICIARALICKPKFVVCDEPVSSLDVSIQSQIINLLKDLKDGLKLTYLFISHDLRVVRNIADRIAVMYFGKIVEMGDNEVIYKNPMHPYTQLLISSVPKIESDEIKEKIIPEGEVPSSTVLPHGCYFYGRCPKRFEKCREEEPLLKEVENKHFVACHLYK